VLLTGLVGQVESCCEHGNEPSGYVKYSKVPEWLRNWWLLE
jgi:hypothetical protein